MNKLAWQIAIRMKKLPMNGIELAMNPKPCYLEVNKMINRIRRLLLVFSCLFMTTLLSHPAFSQSKDTTMKMDMHKQKRDTANQKEMKMSEGEMDMVHPFVTHMGIPDPVGHFAVRLSGVATEEDGNTIGDFGFHLEAGIANRLGLHIRNDRVVHNAHTEIMLQYAVIQSGDGLSGISPFVELEIPTHKGEPHTYGLVGFSTMWSTQRFELNQSLEYSPKEEGLEGSLSMVGNVGLNFFPVLEFILASAKGAAAQNSMIGGLKYRISNAVALGIGYQIPLTEAKEFTHQILFQTDLEW